MKPILTLPEAKDTLPLSSYWRGDIHCVPKRCILLCIYKSEALILLGDFLTQLSAIAHTAVKQILPRPASIVAMYIPIKY